MNEVIGALNSFHNRGKNVIEMSNRDNAEVEFIFDDGRKQAMLLPASQPAHAFQEAYDYWKRGIYPPKPIVQVK